MREIENYLKFKNLISSTINDIHFYTLFICVVSLSKFVGLVLQILLFGTNNCRGPSPEF